MKKIIKKHREYKLSIMREETEDRFFPQGNFEREHMKRWNEYVGFDLTSEEVIEILAVISRKRGIDTVSSPI